MVTVASRGNPGRAFWPPTSSYHQPPDLRVKTFPEDSGPQLSRHSPAPPSNLRIVPVQPPDTMELRQGASAVPEFQTHGTHGHNKVIVLCHQVWGGLLSTSSNRNIISLHLFLGAPMSPSLAPMPSPYLSINCVDDKRQQFSEASRGRSQFFFSEDTFRLAKSSQLLHSCLS